MINFFNKNIIILINIIIWFYIYVKYYYMNWLWYILLKLIFKIYWTAFSSFNKHIEEKKKMYRLILTAGTYKHAIKEISRDNL